MSACSICTNDYGGQCIPTLLTCCLGNVCFGCAENDRASKISNLTGNRKQIQCMFCNKPFHSVKDTPWVVNKTLIEMTGIEVDMSSVREAQAAMKLAASTRSNTNPRRSQRTQEVEQNNEDQNGDGEEAGANNNVAHSTIDGTQQLSSTLSSIQPRRSRRHLQSEVMAGEGTDNGPERNGDTQTAHNQDASITEVAETRARKRTRTRGGETEASTLPHQSLQDEDTPTSSDLQLTVTVNGERYSADTKYDMDVDEDMEDDDGLDEDAELWLNAMSKKNIDVYRIRCYNTEAVKPDDRYARKCSQWCVNNGYTITCLDLVTLLPENQRHDGEALKNKIMSLSREQLKEECIKAQDFDYHAHGPYKVSYKQFIEMKKGDIVVLHTNGGKATSHAPQTLTFGVLQDEELIIMKKDDAITKYDFPWDFCNPGETTNCRIGLLVRRVKWYRQGELRAVRGPAQVNWLAECIPLWLGKVGIKTNKFLKDAIKKMSSKKFLQNTHAIDNEWTMN